MTSRALKSYIVCNVLGKNFTCTKVEEEKSKDSLGIIKDDQTGNGTKGERADDLSGEHACRGAGV